jgi:hypothetical protein
MVRLRVAQSDPRGGGARLTGQGPQVIGRKDPLDQMARNFIGQMQTYTGMLAQSEGQIGVMRTRRALRKAAWVELLWLWPKIKAAMQQVG